MDKESSLHRSAKDRFLGGVCGGLAESLRLDPTLVRLVWAIFTLSSFFSFGLIIYAVCWFVLPVRAAGEELETVPAAAEAMAGGGRRLSLLAGWLLIVAGLLFLANFLSGGQVGLFLRAFRRFLWPASLIIAGAMLLLPPRRRWRQKQR